MRANISAYPQSLGNAGYEWRQELPEDADLKAAFTIHANESITSLPKHSEHTEHNALIIGHTGIMNLVQTADSDFRTYHVTDPSATLQHTVAIHTGLKGNGGFRQSWPRIARRSGKLYGILPHIDGKPPLAEHHDRWVGYSVASHDSTLWYDGTFTLPNRPNNDAHHLIHKANLVMEMMLLWHQLIGKQSWQAADDELTKYTSTAAHGMPSSADGRGRVFFRDIVSPVKSYLMKLPVEAQDSDLSRAVY